MDKMLYKLFDYEVKAADEEKLTVNHFISTEKRDRIGDRMHVKGMKIEGLPVVLLEHGRGFMGTEPIAKPLWIRPGSFKKYKGIEAFTQFFDDDQGVGRRLWKKTTEKYMPNWSIGYGIKEATPFKDRGLDITKWNLYEYSLLGVSMQPDANTIKSMDNKSGLSGLMVKYMPENFIKKAIADQGILTKGSFDGDNNFYTESIENATEEINGAIDEFEKTGNAKSFNMNDGEGTPRALKIETKASVIAMAANVIGAINNTDIPEKDVDNIKQQIDVRYKELGLGEAPWNKKSYADWEKIKAFESDIGKAYNSVFLEKAYPEVYDHIKAIEAENSKGALAKNIPENKVIVELNEKLDRLEKTVNNMVDAVDGKFKEYAGIVKDLKTEKKERKIVFKMPKQQTKEALKEGITKAHIDTIISAMNDKYIKEFRKIIGRVD